MEGGHRSAVHRLAFAAVVSSTGSWAGGLALPFALYQETHSGVWVAASWLLTFGLAGLFSPIGGAIADRFDRRKVMVASNFLAGLTWGILAFVHLPVAMLAIAFIATLAEQPSGPAGGAAMPNLVPQEHLQWANATLGMAWGAASLAGPALGGLLIALVGANATFGVNAFSFFAAAVVVAGVRGSFHEEPGKQERPKGTTTDRGAREGFRVVFSDPVLARLAIIWAFQYFAVDCALVADPPLVEVFAVGAIGYGILNSAWGSGSLVGSWLARRMTPRNGGIWIGFESLVIAVCYAGVAVSPWFFLIPCLMAAVSFADAFNTVAGQGFIQRRTADVVRGRAFAAMRTVGLIANAIAFLIAGAIVNPLGPKAVYALGAVAATLSLPLVPGMIRAVTAADA